MKCYFRDSLGKTWITSLSLIMKQGMIIMDDDEKLKEFRNLCFTIEAVDEDDLILNKYADMDRIVLMKKKYTVCGLVGNYKRDYGSDLYNNNGVNQIEWIAERIKKKLETKSATISLHHAGENILSCLSLLDFKLRDNKLYMNAVYRSQNVFASQPGNIIALRKIQSDIAQKLSVGLGNIELIIFSAHIYGKDFTSVNSILSNFNTGDYL